MKTLVLTNLWGGLGDHLFMSHLPRIAKDTRAYDRVMMSNRAIYRHADYRRLIWEPNPFLDGFCDEEGVCPVFEAPSPGNNILDEIMLKMGLDDGQRGHEPELYYKPAPRPELAGKTLYDPNFVSGVGDIRADRIEQYLHHHGIHIDVQLKPRAGAIIVPATDELETPSIDHYCSAIASCGRFLCLTSGGATLAAALRKPAIAFYGRGQKPMFHHSRLHQYVYAGPRFAWARERSRLLRRCAERVLSTFTGGSQS